MKEYNSKGLFYFYSLCSVGTTTPKHTQRKNALVLGMNGGPSINELAADMAEQQNSAELSSPEDERDSPPQQRDDRRASPTQVWLTLFSVGVQIHSICGPQNRNTIKYLE